MARICVVGSSNMDMLFRTASLPRPGETLTGRAFRLDFGGKGANQAVTAARLGASVALVSRVGHDVFGEQMLGHYRAEGIDTRHVLADGREASGVAAIVVDDRAQNCIVVVPGANGALSPADVRAAAPAIRAADVLLCQLEVPVESTLEAFRLARPAGVYTVLNPAPAVALPDELLRLTDCCVPNETEAEALTGLPVTTVEQGQAAARRLLGRGPLTVIITLGQRGALLAVAQGVEYFPAVPVEAVDTTGAGDAFIGGLAVFRAENLALPDAVRRADAVAALAVTRPGTQTALPRREEVDAFVAARA